MDRETGDNISEEEYENMREESLEDDMDFNKDMQDESYGYPTPDPKYNQHVFLHQAAFESNDTIKTTFLTTEELGRPLFSVRFMLDLRTMAQNIAVGNYNLDKIAEYWLSKIQNVTNSGMSNEGFTMNLNVTQKRDMVRKKVRDVSGLKNQKEVKKSVA